MNVTCVVNFPVERTRSARPETRLCRALERVDAALAEQAEAIAAWRRALGGLVAATDRLEASLVRYGTVLDGAGVRVRAVQDAAVRLVDVCA